MNIAVINGPNLNLLGTREPEVYGTTTLAEIDERLRVVGEELGVALQFSQHNGEGEIIDAIHQAKGSSNGILINAGAYTHSSLAIRDALVGVEIPFVEVHLSNIYARERMRRRSLLAGDGYELALRGLVRLLPSRG